MTGDDVAQAQTARAILDQDFVLTATVMLEAEWVLKSRYGIGRSQRVQALRMLIDLPHAVDTPDNAAWALDRMAEGADLADMLHVAAAKGASSFATFDKSVQCDAGPDSPVRVETLT